MTQAVQQRKPTSGELLARVKEGDQEAWKLLFDEAYPKVQRIVRRRINQRMRRRCDSADIASSVMADFCAKAGVLEFPCKAALHAYLVQATQQKLIDEQRRQNGKKRDVNREIAVDDADEVVGRYPTPSRIVEKREDYHRLLDAQSPVEREAVTLKSQGDSTEDISRKTGMHPRAIQRLLQKLRLTHPQ